MTHYAVKMAETNHKKGKQKSKFSAFLSAFFAFIKMYVLLFGFLDGRNGLVLASGQFHYTYRKYLKITIE
jgi:(heptosyl)LPS beta-1,4-glucosyltransferase